MSIATEGSPTAIAKAGPLPLKMNAADGDRTSLASWVDQHRDNSNDAERSVAVRVLDSLRDQSEPQAPAFLTNTLTKALATNTLVLSLPTSHAYFQKSWDFSQTSLLACHTLIGRWKMAHQGLRDSPLSIPGTDTLESKSLSDDDFALLDESGELSLVLERVLVGLTMILSLSSSLGAPLALESDSGQYDEDEPTLEESLNVGLKLTRQIVPEAELPPLLSDNPAAYQLPLLNYAEPTDSPHSKTIGNSGRKPAPLSSKSIPSIGRALKVGRAPVLSIYIGMSTSAVTVLDWTLARSGEPVATYPDDSDNIHSYPNPINISLWPGSENSDFHGETVPSLLVYDQSGKLMACGAEAASRITEIQAVERDWIYVENFKSILHPPSIRQEIDISPSPLPSNVDLLTVYSDFLSYLLTHTRRYLRDITGWDSWHATGEEAAHIVLPHPNGWGENQRHILRYAAVKAGLVSREKAKTNIHFVEEAEASTYYYLNDHPVIANQLSAGSKFLICNAGVLTTTIAAYEVRRNLPSGAILKELSQPFYIGAGGAHVDALFKSYLINVLSLAAMENNLPTVESDEISEYVSDGLRDFRHSGKRRFHLPTDTYHIQIGGRRMNSEVPPIKKGMLTLEGTQMEAFFAPSVDKITVEVNRRILETSYNLIILTGGFAQNSYFKQALKTIVDGRARIIVANTRTSRTVAVGGVGLLTDKMKRVEFERTK